MRDRPGAAADTTSESMVRRAYDTAAQAYAAAHADELARKPIDRALVDAVAALCSSSHGPDVGGARLLDAGCGPGHVVRHLAAHGHAMSGIDLSPAMVTIARREAPTAEIRVGTLLDLPYPDQTFDGVLSLYSIIHLAPARVPLALAELRRVLVPGGVLLLSFHNGDRAVHVDELCGEAVDLDGHLFDPDEVADQVTASGFDIEARLTRDPVPGIELPTERTSLVARRPVPPTGAPHRTGASLP